MATREDGAPMDQHERAKGIAQSIFEGTSRYRQPAASPYVAGQPISGISKMTVDSPEFFGAYIHNLNCLYEQSPGNIQLARVILQPDGFGYVSQDRVMEYWRTSLDISPADSNTGRFAHNPAKFVEYLYKYMNYNYDNRMVFIKFCQLLGIRWNTVYNTPEQIENLWRSMCGFYSTGPGKDIAKEVGAKYNKLNKGDTGLQAVEAVFRPFLDAINVGFAYSSLSQLHGENFSVIFKYMYAFRDYPGVLYWSRKLNSILGTAFGPGWIGDDPARNAVYIFNQMLGRLSQRENLPAAVALKRLALNPNLTQPNQSTPKLVLFYYHAMCECAEHPNSGWQQLMDTKFEGMFEALNEVQWNPRVFFWKFFLYQMLDLRMTGTGTSPEWAALQFDFMVYCYSKPGICGANLEYYKDCIKVDPSPGQLATFYDMYSGVMAYMRKLSPNSLFTPGKGLASVTPRPMIILAASMRDNPIVQAAMDRYQKFMGVEGDNTSKEDVDKYVAKIQENYLASMSNL